MLLLKNWYYSTQNYPIEIILKQYWYEWWKFLLKCNRFYSIHSTHKNTHRQRRNFHRILFHLKRRKLKRNNIVSVRYYIQFKEKFILLYNLFSKGKSSKNIFFQSKKKYKRIIVYNCHNKLCYLEKWIKLDWKANLNWILIKKKSKINLII